MNHLLQTFFPSRNIDQRYPFRWAVTLAFSKLGLGISVGIVANLLGVPDSGTSGAITVVASMMFGGIAEQRKPGVLPPVRYRVAFYSTMMLAVFSGFYLWALTWSESSLDTNQTSLHQLVSTSPALIFGIGIFAGLLDFLVTAFALKMGARIEQKRRQKTGGLL
jgi:hypothetical protein